MFGTPLLEEALASFDELYRVLLEDEIGYGAEAVLQSDGTAALTLSTSSETGELTVAMLRVAPRDLQTRAGIPVDVYVDSSFLRTAEWRGTAGSWQLAVAPRGRTLVLVNSTFTAPLSELHLVRVTSADFTS